MSEFSDRSQNESVFNDFHFQNKLLNYLINYLIRNRNRNRYNLTIRVDPRIYEDFKFVCQKLGLLKGTSRGNLVIEGFMKWFIEKFDTPRIIQTTLFYKPEIKVETPKVELNVAQKLELKLVKRDLTFILDKLEKGEGDKVFLLAKLREVLSKAIRIYNSTSDQEMENLFRKVEKWIER